jgi:hypothetical protein
MENILAIAVPVALVAIGATIAILRLIAPKTDTKRDDKALEVLERIEKVLDGNSEQ